MDGTSTLAMVTSPYAPGVAPRGVRTTRARVGGASPWPLFLTCAVMLIVSPHDRTPAVDWVIGVTPNDEPTRSAGIREAIVMTEASTPRPIPSLFVSDSSGIVLPASVLIAR